MDTHALRVRSIRRSILHFKPTLIKLRFMKCGQGYSPLYQPRDYWSFRALTKQMVRYSACSETTRFGVATSPMER